MKKSILITGATDGIGLETALKLRRDGHDLLIHGRNPGKLDATRDRLTAIPGVGNVDSFIADLSQISAVDTMAKEIKKSYTSLDVLINNAGIFKTNNAVTSAGLDIRFVVNTLAPYRLTLQLKDLFGSTSRIVNVSSAAQAPVNLNALKGKVKLDAMDAYAQSKLAITMWSKAMSAYPDAPVVLAVNPGSLLASKMVKEGFGVEGSDLAIGADILCRAALSEEFASASGQYYDNDSGKFAPPHADGLDSKKIEALMQSMDNVISELVN